MQITCYFRHGAIALLMAGFALNAPAATVTALPSTPSNIITSGFESPAVATEPGGFLYTPAGTNWTFTGRTGIAAVGSNFNVTSAPQGTQVGILQRPQPGVPGPSTMTRSFTIGSSGRYRLSLQSAQRLTQQQIASVRIDGNEIGQFKPAGANFEPVVFDALILGSGNHQLSFTALVLDDDNTLFIDDVRIDSIAGEARAWSNPATWNTGVVPTDNDDVVIPAGSSVLMSGTLLAKSVSVSGSLYCADNDIALETQWMAVMGRLVCGSSGSRYTNNFVLTLKGADDGGDIMGMGDKFLGAMGAGAIELHGEQRTSFVQLADTADIGSSTIALSGVVDWRTGDELVISPTRWITDAQGLPINEAEVVAVHSITTAGPLNDRYSVVQLKTALTRRHFGKTKTYSKPDNSLSWTLDERAEVGLLTRNIRIEGDAASATAGFGGHMMTMRGSSVHANGIELRRMGQKAKLARYPFHWHLARDVPGQYIQNSSIHESYNRCIVVHGSHQARVADNVCYNFIGHGYFLENGNEKNNTFDHNLAVWGKKPQGPVATAPNLPLETDLRIGAASSGPAAFWISHPNNVVTNNVAAGIEGAAFWYHLEAAPFVPPAEPGCDAPPVEPGCNRPPADTIAPKAAPFGTFDNNRAYASRQGFSSCLLGGDTYGMDTPNALFERLTTTNVGQGIWPCGGGFSRFHRAIVANTENGMQAPLPFAFSDSLFVAYSDNEPPSAARAADVPWAAVWVYDQGFDFDNVHFENYDRPAMSVFQRMGGAHKATSNRSSGLTFKNSPNVFRDIFKVWLPGNIPSYWGEVIHDLDGSLIGLGATGQPRAFVSSHPLMSDASCYRPAGIGSPPRDTGVDGYGCPHTYATMLIDEFLTPATPALSPAPFVTIVRSDGVNDTVQHGLITLRLLNNFIADGSFRYGYRYLDGIRHNRLGISLFWARMPGTASVHEIMDVPDSTVIHQDFLPYWTPVTTQAAFDAATTNVYFHRTDSASLLFKIIPTVGIDWFGYSGFGLCLDGNPQCGPPNAPTQRTLSLPSVQVVSPLDRARVNTGLLSVTANLGDTNGLVSATLWVGDTKGSTAHFLTNPLTATPTLSVNLPTPGSYPLKVVVKNLLGQSYTSVQQLHVGDSAPRIEITSAAHTDNSTHFSATVPDLTFASHNWPAVDGKHVHWFVDGKDQGDTAGTSIALGGLSQGRHDIEVALADAAHNVYPMRDKRVVYIARDGYLADFEDGVDSRGSAIALPGSSRIPITYDWTALRIGRDNPADNDINHFLVPMPAAGHTPCTPFASSPAVASYTLALQPAMNWSSYARLQINYAGPGFDVLVQYVGDATPSTIGCAVPSGGANATFNLPSRPGVPVSRIILQHYANPPSCAGCLQRQHLQSIRLLNP